MTDSAPIAEPLGHETLIGRLAPLADAVRGGDEADIAHAYLFSGADGVGKFATARWWASRLKCDAIGGCDAGAGACPSCRQLAAGAHPDVGVLEPAEVGKDIGIDDARELIRSLTLKPLRHGPRIAIVRDAHALTVHAQSALLKLLEEPPGFAVIVLVTHNLAALLPTIRSRCQTLRFGRLSREQVERIVRADGRNEAEAHSVAAAAAGSAGRAISLTAESLEDRRQLIEDFDSFRAGGAPDIDTLVADLVERHKAGRPELDVLLERQIEAVEATLDCRGDAASDSVATAHDGDPAARARALLNTADRIHWTIGALARHANAKLAIRDLLLDVRGR